MKTKLTLLGSAALLAATASLYAQSAVTKPVGYHTEDLITGFNLIGVNVGNAVSAAGDFDADAPTDTDVNFNDLLTADTPYTVQNLTTGDTAAVTAWDETTLTTDPVLTVTSGNSYEIRQDQTIASLFGAANEAGLAEGSDKEDTTADYLWVPKGDGTYDLIYRNNVDQVFPALSPGWRYVAGGNEDAANHVVPFEFSMFVQVRGAPLSLVFVGHVRGDAPGDAGQPNASQTNVDLITGFNALNRVIPVGMTLADINMADYLTAAPEADADRLWNPKGDGTYDLIYNNSVDQVFPALSPGLRFVAGGNDDASGVEVASGFLIERKAEAGTIAVEVWSGLDI